MSLPVQRYTWLMNSHPQTPEEIQLWISNAESVLIYCFVADYPYLDMNHAKKLMLKSEKIGQVNNFYEQHTAAANRIN